RRDRAPARGRRARGGRHRSRADGGHEERAALPAADRRARGTRLSGRAPPLGGEVLDAAAHDRPRIEPLTHEQAGGERRARAARTNAARVANEPPSSATLVAPGRWPAVKTSTGRASSTSAPSELPSSSSGGRAPTHGPRLSATRRSVVGGFGVESEAASSTNA